MNFSRGIVYVAWGKKHTDEAIVSAIRNKSGYPTCIITDSPATCLDAFDYVRLADFYPYSELKPFTRKFCFLLHSPFESTCLLDSDCFAMGNLDLGFDLAEEGFFSLAHAPTMTIKEPGGKEYIHYNAGVMFSRTPAKHIHDAFMKKAVEIGGHHIGDEGIITVSLRDDKIPHMALPNSFNVVRAGKPLPVPIRVYHSRYPVGDPPTTLAGDHFGNQFVQ